METRKQKQVRITEDEEDTAYIKDMLVQQAIVTQLAQGQFQALVHTSLLHHLIHDVQAEVDICTALTNQYKAGTKTPTLKFTHSLTGEVIPGKMCEHCGVQCIIWVQVEDLTLNLKMVCLLNCYVF